MEQTSAPCLGCKKRVVGCHSTCGDYKTYKEEKASDKRKRETYSEQRHIVTSFELDAKRRLVSNRRKKIRYSKER